MSVKFTGVWHGTVTSTRECRIDLDDDGCILLTVDGATIHLKRGDTATLDHKIDLFDNNLVHAIYEFSFPKKMKQ